MSSELSLDELAVRIAALAGDGWRHMARWLDLVAEFDRREGAGGWGFRGTAEWLGWRCELVLRTARDHVRVARRLQELPLVRAAFRSGELSYSKVRALARTSHLDDEGALLELARTLTAGQLELAVRALRTAESADLDAARAAYERRTLDWWWEPDGTLRVNGRLAPDDGTAFIEAVDTAAEALHGGGLSADAPAECGAPVRRPPRGARRADALVEICLNGAPATRVVLHADPAALACQATAPKEREGIVCALQDGPAVPSETARRLSCDAEIMGIADTHDLGRRRRVVSPALRRSIEHRDSGCRFPGCDHAPLLQAA